RVLSRRARVRGVVGPRARCTPRTCVLGAADVVADGLDAVVGHVDEQVVVVDAGVDDADDPVVGVAGAVTGGDALEADELGAGVAGGLGEALVEAILDLAEVHGRGGQADAGGVDQADLAVGAGDRRVAGDLDLGVRGDLLGAVDGVAGGDAQVLLDLRHGHAVVQDVRVGVVRAGEDDHLAGAGVERAGLGGSVDLVDHADATGAERGARAGVVGDRGAVAGADGAGELEVRAAAHLVDAATGDRGALGGQPVAGGRVGRQGVAEDDGVAG